jgi:hypothetical protein
MKSQVAKIKFEACSSRWQAFIVVLVLLFGASGVYPSCTPTD